MGYRSDVRIITSKKGFEELTGFVKKYLGDRSYDYNLLDHLGFKHETENAVFFGWNDVKWYEGCGCNYEHVDAIMEGLYSLANNDYSYRYARMGEDYDDYEERYEDGENDKDAGLDYIYVTRHFDDNETIEYL